MKCTSREEREGEAERNSQKTRPIHEGTKSIYCMVLPLLAKIGSAGDLKEESVTVIVTNLIDIYEITLQKDVEIF